MKRDWLEPLLIAGVVIGLVLVVLSLQQLQPRPRCEHSAELEQLERLRLETRKLERAYGELARVALELEHRCPTPSTSTSEL